MEQPPPWAGSASAAAGSRGLDEEVLDEEVLFGEPDEIEDLGEAEALEKALELNNEIPTPIEIAAWQHLCQLSEGDGGRPKPQTNRQIIGMAPSRQAAMEERQEPKGAPAKRAPARREQGREDERQIIGMAPSRQAAMEERQEPKGAPAKRAPARREQGREDERQIIGMAPSRQAAIEERKRQAEVEERKRQAERGKPKEASRSGGAREAKSPPAIGARSRCEQGRGDERQMPAEMQEYLLKAKAPAIGARSRCEQGRVEERKRPAEMQEYLLKAKSPPAIGARSRCEQGRVEERKRPAEMQEYHLKAKVGAPSQLSDGCGGRNKPQKQRVIGAASSGRG
jgi:hypothetical protein